MIILGGIIGICLLAGGVRHHEQKFTLRGVSAAMSVLAAMAVLSLVLPNYTVDHARAELCTVATGVRRGRVADPLRQLRRGPDGQPPRLFPARGRPAGRTRTPNRRPIERPGPRSACCSSRSSSVVLLAKGLAPTVEAAVIGAGLPLATVGVVIAALVLVPGEPGGLARGEAQSAADQPQPRARLGARHDRPDDPVGRDRVAGARPAAALGISAKGMTLLALSLFVTTLSLGTGRTTALGGAVHLVIFAAYLFTTIVP